VIAEALWVSAIRVSVLSCGAVLADYQSPKGPFRIHSGELYQLYVLKSKYIRLVINPNAIDWNADQ
jgi:hypothetical protein